MNRAEALMVHPEVLARDQKFRGESEQVARRLGEVSSEELSKATMSLLLAAGQPLANTTKMQPEDSQLHRFGKSLRLGQERLYK